MDTIYQNIDKIPLSVYTKLLVRETRTSVRELYLRSRQGYSSHGIIRNLITAILIFVTRWITVALQIAALLVMGGFEAYSFIIQTDIFLILLNLYSTYNTISESINVNGLSPRSYNIMWQYSPLIILDVILITILGVVRGNRSRLHGQSCTLQGLSPPLDMDYANASPLASSDRADTLSTENHTARSSDVTLYRIALHEFSGSQRFRPGGIWCLHPDNSLRSAWLDARNLIEASWSGVTLSGLPLACIRTVIWFIIVSSGYVYARTLLRDENDGGSQSSMLHRVYKYICGQLGIEDEPPSNPEGPDDIILERRGTSPSVLDEELHSVTVL